jgi:hypothetical protein
MIGFLWAMSIKLKRASLGDYKFTADSEMIWAGKSIKMDFVATTDKRCFLNPGVW